MAPSAGETWAPLTGTMSSMRLPTLPAARENSRILRGCQDDQRNNWGGFGCRLVGGSDRAAGECASSGLQAVEYEQVFQYSNS